MTVVFIMASYAIGLIRSNLPQNNEKHHSFVFGQAGFYPSVYMSLYVLHYPPAGPDGECPGRREGYRVSNHLLSEGDVRQGDLI
jgi:hypothetical protein